MTTKTTIEETIVKETPLTFAQKVEDLVWMEDIPYLDAITKIMVENEMEPDFVAKLMTPELKSKLRKETEKLNLTEKSDTLNMF